MNEYQKTFIDDGASFLMHYNHNHDPRTGRFTNSLFVSGSSKTQSKDSDYYRRALPKEVRKKLKESMKAGDRIIVGDAPGIDRQVQDYLNSKRYKNVEVYGPGKQVRYSANKDWKTHTIDAPEFEEGSKEWLAKKDEVMTNEATKGLAIILDEGSRATRDNVSRLVKQGKPVDVFQLNRDRKDDWNTAEPVRQYLQSMIDSRWKPPADVKKALDSDQIKRATRINEIQKDYLKNNPKNYTDFFSKEAEKYYADQDKYFRNNKEYQQLLKEQKAYETMDLSTDDEAIKEAYDYLVKRKNRRD